MPAKLRRRIEIVAFFLLWDFCCIKGRTRYVQHASDNWSHEKGHGSKQGNTFLNPAACCIVRISCCNRQL